MNDCYKIYCDIRVSRARPGAPRGQWFESYAFYPKHGYTEYEPRYTKKQL